MVLDPDEILLDAHNLPEFNRQQLEGQLERPLQKRNFYLVSFVLGLFGLVFLVRASWLMVWQGTSLAARAEANTLDHESIYAERGALLDRTGRPLAWTDETGRHYIENAGFAHVLGHLGYPTPIEIKIDGFNPKELVGQDGAEAAFDVKLRGQNGLRIEESDATGKIISDHLLEQPQKGADISLSIDVQVEAPLYQALANLVEEQKFSGGAAVVMDVHTGEIVALANYPEFEPAKLLPGASSTAAIRAWQNDHRNPFLNRAISGLYSSGSTIKTVVASAALNEGVITPEKKILSTGSISVPNPYDPKTPSIFKDWRANGWMDIRGALAWSSDVYFYEVGGGYPGQIGLGIDRLAKYFQMFGLSQKSGIELPGEAAGTIPTPAWKAKNFPDDPAWRIGDTYHTAIGQYGIQVTPLQMVRSTAAIANGGYLLTPTILKQATSTSPFPSSAIHLPILTSNLAIVREGMRQAVTDGLSKAINTGEVELAAKTGTAEIGVFKKKVNSWVIGFWPYQDPHYAIAVVMEAGPSTNNVGSAFVYSRLIQSLGQNAPNYLH